MNDDRPYEPEIVVTSVEEIRSTLGEVFEPQVRKVIDHVDHHCRAWIERSPFVVIASAAASGAMDLSPKGDPAGFVQVLDARTLAVPDRPGNRRADTFLNVLENPEVAVLFVVPKRREVLRVAGTARIVKDPALLESMTVKDKTPILALVVRVREAMFHCGKSMIRSGMWEPDEWGPVEGLPTYAEVLVDHADPGLSVDEMQDRQDFNESELLY